MNQRILRQAQELQNKLAQAQEELGQEVVTASSGGGAVTVTVNGHQEVQSVSIAPEAIDPDDPSLLEDMVQVAVNDALKQAQALTAKKLGSLTGGLNIPGLT